MKFPPVVCVRWLDACHRAGVFTREEINPPIATGLPRLDRVELYTAGWLVGETDDTLTLAKDFEPAEDEFRDLTHIPKGMVISVSKYAYPRRAQKRIATAKK